MNRPPHFPMRAICLLAAAVLSAAPSLAATLARVTGASADADRAGVVVSFKLPAGASHDVQLGGPGGVTPVQVLADSTAQFVVAEIKAGASPVFALEAAPAPAASVRCGQTGDLLKLSQGGQPLLDYWKTEEPLPNDKVDKN